MPSWYALRLYNSTYSARTTLKIPSVNQCYARPRNRMSWSAEIRLLHIKERIRRISSSETGPPPWHLQAAASVEECFSASHPCLCFFNKPFPSPFNHQWKYSTRQKVSVFNKLVWYDNLHRRLRRQRKMIRQVLIKNNFRVRRQWNLWCVLLHCTAWQTSKIRVSQICEDEPCPGYAYEGSTVCVD